MMLSPEFMHHIPIRPDPVDNVKAADGRSLECYGTKTVEVLVPGSRPEPLPVLSNFRVMSIKKLMSVSKMVSLCVTL